MAFSKLMEKVFLQMAKKIDLKNYIKPPLWWHMGWYLLVPFLMPLGAREGLEPGCQFYSPGVTGFSGAGDIVIGAVFPLHVDRITSQVSFNEKPTIATCQRFIFQNYQWLQAMLFAIQEINRNTDLLPNISLGFQIYDSCADMSRSLLGTLWMLTGQEPHVLNFRYQRDVPLAGIIGDAGSSSSILMARVMGLYRLPQVSYFSTNPLLSDRNQFPSFFRTIPSDDFQFLGLAHLVISFNWTWVGLLAEDNDYGQHGIQTLQEELPKAGVCIAFCENIILSRVDRNAHHIIRVIKSSTAKAIVMIGIDSRIMPLLDELVSQNMTGKTFLASEAWSTSALLSGEKYMRILTGTIGFAVYSGEMPGFKDYLSSVHLSKAPNDIFLNEFWEAAFRCKWPEQKLLLGLWNNQTKLCTGVETLDSVEGMYNDVTSPRITFNVYNAVYAIALALHDLDSCRRGSGPFHHLPCANIFDFPPWQLLHYLRDLHFKSTGKTKVSFDSFGNPPAQYDIVHWQTADDGKIKHRTVGHYDSSSSSGSKLFINTTAIRWTRTAEVPISVCSPSCLPGFRKTTKEGEPVCCFLCIPCPQGEVTNQTDSSECIKCPWDQWPNSKQKRCVLKPFEFLSFEDPLGAALAGISIFLSTIPVTILGLYIHVKNTPIVKANNRSLSYLLLLSLTMCFLCSLCFIGYPTPEKCQFRQVAFGIIFSICVASVLAKTIMVVVAFNATKPNSHLRSWVGPRLSYLVISVSTFIPVLLCIIWLGLSPPFSQYNIQNQPGIIIVECNEGSPIAFWCMLGYLGLLSSISFVVAFLARKLPDSFNEAKFITFSMLAFLTVWVSFLPAYLSTKGKYMVAMEIFAILSSSSSLVSCIFFPKCYIILLRPQMNTKEYMQGRGLSRKSNIDGT